MSRKTRRDGKLARVPTIQIETLINTSAARCFDAARNMDMHCRTVSHTRERIVGGVSKGLIELGQSVTFEGVHFGVRQKFTSQITEFERPNFFVDEMTQGAFHSMCHRHVFIEYEQKTLMRDVIEWRSPLGVLGKIADALFLKRYLRTLILYRGRQLKEIIENE